MFKIIGAMVVYGFALYGVVQGAEWLNTQRNKRVRSKAGNDEGSGQSSEVPAGHERAAASAS